VLTFAKVLIFSNSMYSFLKTLHSHNRHLVLLVAVLVIIGSIIGLIGQRKWGKQNKILSLAFLIIMDIQILLGLILYLGVSELGIKLFFNKDINVMESPYRQMAVEHVALMLMAVVLVHVGYKKIKTVQEKHKAVLYYYGAALLFILAGIPWDKL